MSENNQEVADAIVRLLKPLHATERDDVIRLVSKRVCLWCGKMDPDGEPIRCYCRVFRGIYA